jgi:hypothetical protein
MSQTPRDRSRSTSLGFDLKDTFGPDGRIDWGVLESERAQLMLQRAGRPIDRDKQAVLFYLYSDDLAALRDHLLANGVAVGEIVDGSPGPDQEMGLVDPDGYCLMIAQAQVAERAPAAYDLRWCQADADTPRNRRFAFCPRADARVHRLAGLLTEDFLT